jgi:hypothetical protein
MPKPTSSRTTTHKVCLSECEEQPLFRQGQEFLRSERAAELAERPLPHRHPSKLERLK